MKLARRNYCILLGAGRSTEQLLGHSMIANHKDSEEYRQCVLQQIGSDVGTTKLVGQYMVTHSFGGTFEVG